MARERANGGFVGGCCPSQGVKRGSCGTLRKAMLAVVFLMAGCATQTFMIKKESMNAQLEFDKGQAFFIRGLGQKKFLNAAEICGGEDKVYKIETKKTFVNGLLGFVTFGIYTPRQARVYCTWSSSQKNRVVKNAAGE